MGLHVLARGVIFVDLSLAQMAALGYTLGALAGLDAHGGWIRILLEEYYDPMYDYQLSKREGDTLMRGDRDAVVAKALEITASAPSH